MSFPNFRAPILLPLDTAPSAVYLLQSFQQRKGNSKYDEISLKENNQDNDIETKDIRARINSLHSISRKRPFVVFHELLQLVAFVSSPCRAIVKLQPFFSSSTALPPSPPQPGIFFSNKRTIMN
jgi:hypothetical protein